ncbi:MAG: thymidylate synthase [Nanoarchaeota archaeon]
MQAYLDLVKETLSEGTYKPNRTGVDAISHFAGHLRVDLRDGFPLLTTKKMDGYRWRSLIHEFLWYLSGEEHIRDLREKTKIWDAWADQEGRLETAYGRFWRRFPIPSSGLDGEAWADESSRWVGREEDGSLTFDQIQYVIDTLRETPNSRRMVVSAWHPANAAVSKLPPCHYTFAFAVHDERLNLHMTQRSADIALGVPFNIAAYSMLDMIVAQEVGLRPGVFSHTLVDLHAYCGRGERATFYEQNHILLSRRVREATRRADYLEIREWIEKAAPAEADGDLGMDHVPGLLEQMSRVPYASPRLVVAKKPLDSLVYDDISLADYRSHQGITFSVAI